MEYIPGWDCHGLPIELKAVKSTKGKYLPAEIIRTIARRFAEKTIIKQMEGLKVGRVLGEWDRIVGVRWVGPPFWLANEILSMKLDSWKYSWRW